nr:hypothetical protein Q903MT_gene3019 [Picea sitchensis]
MLAKSISLCTLCTRNVKPPSDVSPRLHPSVARSLLPLRSWRVRDPYGLRGQSVYCIYFKYDAHI